MSRILLAAALLITIGFGACKQEEVDPTIPGHYVKKGSIRFKNNSNDLYDIYLDDYRYGNLYGGNTSTYPNIPIGVHRVKAVQVEHIVGTATLRQQQVTVQADSTVEFSFP